MKLDELNADIYDQVCHALRHSIFGKGYRTLAGEMGYKEKDLRNFDLKEDPARALLDNWGVKSGNNVEKLFQMLSKLERDDVIEIIQNKSRI